MNGKKRQLMCARRKIGARALQCAFKFLPRRCSEKNITTYVHIQTSAPIGALEVKLPILGKINGPITKEPTNQQTDIGSQYYEVIGGRRGGGAYLSSRLFLKFFFLVRER